MKALARIGTMALVGSLLLAGCAQIPTDGPVVGVKHVEEEREQGVRYFPSGPITGASREEIVQGFIDAGTGVHNDFAVAREFLTPDSAPQWQPGERTIIADGQVSMKSVGSNLVEVTVQSYGEVDANGNYHFYTQQQSVSLRFELTTVAGELRIKNPPNVIVLQEQEFGDLFTQRTLRYFDGQFTYLTGDLRWVVANRDEATRVTTLLLEGPNDWLAQGNAVRSAFPAGVKLLTPVTQEGGTGIVNLSSEVSQASPEQWRLIRLQLEQTLQPILQIAQVEIRVNGSKIDVQLPDTSKLVLEADVSAAPLVAQDNKIGYLSGNDLRAPSGADNVGAVVDEYDAIGGALSMSRQTAALLTEDATLGMRFEDTEPQLIDTRAGQIEPALDNWDFIWTQSTKSPGLWVTRIGESEPDHLPLPEGIGHEFTSLQVSRDGTRVAFLFTEDDHVTLAISPIERDEQGRPLSLGEPLRIEMQGAEAVDVAWGEPNSVAMLVGLADGSTDVRVYRVGGELASLGSIQDAVQVAGSNTLSGMRVVDKNGTIYASRGSGWSSNEATISFLFAQE